MVPPSIPKELDKLVLPDYVIEPPDVLAISAVSLIPKQPYHLRPLDIVSVQVSESPVGAIHGEPAAGLAVSGQFPVGLDGLLMTGTYLDYVYPRPENRGKSDTDEHSDNKHYQPIQAAGRTVEEVRADIEQRATQQFNAVVSVSIVSIAAQQDIVGEHLVAPDGHVTLGSYGRVCLVGKTIDEARRAIEDNLSQFFEDPRVSVDVYGYNSKVYYVITQGAGLGDQVIRMPVKGSETALDAIAEIQGLTAVSSLDMWVARPGFNQEGGDQILPIDWLGITQRGDYRTNYQLMPGDRLYVAENRLVALDSALAKLFSPVERVFGVTLLGVQTANSFATFGQTNGGGF